MGEFLIDTDSCGLEEMGGGYRDPSSKRYPEVHLTLAIRQRSFHTK